MAVSRWSSNRLGETYARPRNARVPRPFPGPGGPRISSRPLQAQPPSTQGSSCQTFSAGAQPDPELILVRGLSEICWRMTPTRLGSDAYSVASTSNMYDWVIPISGSVCWELVFQMRPAKVSERTKRSPPSEPLGSVVQKRVLVGKQRRATGKYRRRSMTRILSEAKSVLMMILRSAEDVLDGPRPIPPAHACIHARAASAPQDATRAQKRWPRPRI